jgi:hypothetical protein
MTSHSSVSHFFLSPCGRGWRASARRVRGPYPHRFARVYDGGMETPSVITDALNRRRRNPRAVHRCEGEWGTRKSPHNFVAQPAKRKAGARLGNRHAARRASEMVERHARLDALVQQVSTLADAAEASVRERNQQHAALTVLLAEPHPLAEPQNG